MWAVLCAPTYKNTYVEPLLTLLTFLYTLFIDGAESDKYSTEQKLMLIARIE